MILTRLALSLFFLSAQACLATSTEQHAFVHPDSINFVSRYTGFPPQLSGYILAVGADSGQKVSREEAASIQGLMKRAKESGKLVLVWRHVDTSRGSLQAVHIKTFTVEECETPLDGTPPHKPVRWLVGPPPSAYKPDR